MLLPILNLMRILVTVPSIGSVYGGPSKSVRELAQALGQQGASVDLVTTDANGSTKLDLPLQTWLDRPGYRLQLFPSRVWNDYKWSAALANWLKHHLKNYDTVHINSIFSLTNLPFYKYCHQQKIPYVIAPRGMLEPWALAYKAYKKRLYYRLLEQRALNRASAIHTLASIEAEKISTLNLQPPAVTISNGIHRQDFENPSDPTCFYKKFPHTKGKKLILFLGRIDPKKGLDLLASAFELIKHQFPEAHLIIAGPDNVGFLPTVQQYFAKMQCLDNVTFTGLLSGDLKYAALAAADIYIAPSYSEGFSMSVLEGMASGLPCILTTGCNFPEAASAKAAHVVEPNAEQLGMALRQCLEDLETAREMGQRARRLILQDYTWDKAADNLIEVYQSILQQRPIPQCLLPLSSLARTS